MSRYDDDAWQRWLTLLDAHIAEHGHPYPPQYYVAPGGEKLGKWLGIALWAHRTGRSRLPGERAADLAARGIELDAARFSRRWILRLRELADYVDEHGDSLVPNADSGLGRWVRQMRQRHRAGTLTPSQIRQLEAAGMVWMVSRDEWPSLYQQGWSLQQIATAAKAPMSRVYDDLKGRVQIRPTGGQRHPLTIEQAVATYRENGNNAAAAARALGVSDRLMRVRLYEAGLGPEPHGRAGRRNAST